jgi:hypothetical protein
MKRILFTAFLAVLTLSLTSCPGDDPFKANPAALIGTWDMTTNHYIYKENGKIVTDETEPVPYAERTAITFKTDGSCIAEHYYEGELDDTLPGTWTLTDNVLTINADGDRLVHTVEKLDSRTLVISLSYQGVEEGVPYDEYESMTFAKAD